MFGVHSGMRANGRCFFIKHLCSLLLQLVFLSNSLVLSFLDHFIREMPQLAQLSTFVTGLWLFFTLFMSFTISCSVPALGVNSLEVGIGHLQE